MSNPSEIHDDEEPEDEEEISVHFGDTYLGCGFAVFLVLIGIAACICALGHS